MIELKEERMEATQFSASEGAFPAALRAASNAPSDARPDPEVAATGRRRQFSSSENAAFWRLRIAALSQAKSALCCARKGFTPPI